MFRQSVRTGCYSFILDIVDGGEKGVLYQRRCTHINDERMTDLYVWVCICMALPKTTVYFFNALVHFHEQDL